MLKDRFVVKKYEGWDPFFQRSRPAFELRDSVLDIKLFASFDQEAIENECKIYNIKEDKYRDSLIKKFVADR